MVNYKYCPQCKKSLETSQEHPYCTNCDIYIYQNPKPTASVLPIKNGKVLISIRAIKPYKGSYDTIGGFLQLDEHPEEAAIRETKEETGLDIKILHLLPMHKERYGKDGDHLINIFYVGKVVGGKMKPADDVESLHWIPINKVPKMPFKSANLAIKDLQKWYEKQNKK